MRLNLMIEGQEDVTWDQWVALAQATEESGLEGLFRSDHYLSVQGHAGRGALDAWTTLAGLAVLTDRIRLGTMVSPATFRHPSVLAKSVVTVDHISGGRVELGMGAGWHEREHDAYGFPFPPTGERMAELEEQLVIVTRHLEGAGPFDHHGVRYDLEGCEALPPPVQTPRPPLTIGGSGGPRSAALAARFADEYDTTSPTPQKLTRVRDAIARACDEAGREPLTLSVMTGCIVGRDEAEFRDRAERLMRWSGRGGDVEAWLDGLRDAWILGTVERAATRLTELEEAGVQRIYLQHQLHDDVDMVALLGELA